MIYVQVGYLTNFTDLVTNTLSIINDTQSKIGKYELKKININIKGDKGKFDMYYIRYSWQSTCK